MLRLRIFRAISGTPHAPCPPHPPHPPYLPHPPYPPYPRGTLNALSCNMALTKRQP
jgi:hypothetical protein